MSPIPIALSAKTSQFELTQRRYLRTPVSHGSFEINGQLVSAVKQVIQPAAVFLYRDRDLDRDLNVGQWTLDVFTPVASNEDVARIEAQLEVVVAAFPADLLWSEVILESDFLEIQQELYSYRA